MRELDSFRSLAEIDGEIASTTTTAYLASLKSLRNRWTTPVCRLPAEVLWEIFHHVRCEEMTMAPDADENSPRRYDTAPQDFLAVISTCAAWRAAAFERHSIWSQIHCLYTPSILRWMIENNQDGLVYLSMSVRRYDARIAPLLPEQRAIVESILAGMLGSLDLELRDDETSWVLQRIHASAPWLKSLTVTEDYGANAHDIPRGFMPRLRQLCFHNVSTILLPHAPKLEYLELNSSFRQYTTEELHDVFSRLAMECPALTYLALNIHFRSQAGLGDRPPPILLPQLKWLGLMGVPYDLGATAAFIRITSSCSVYISSADNHWNEGVLTEAYDHLRALISPFSPLSTATVSFTSTPIDPPVQGMRVLTNKVAISLGSPREIERAAPVFIEVVNPGSRLWRNHFWSLHGLDALETLHFDRPVDLLETEVYKFAWVPFLRELRVLGVLRVNCGGAAERLVRALNEGFMDAAFLPALQHVVFDGVERPRGAVDGGESDESAFPFGGGGDVAEALREMCEVRRQRGVPLANVSIFAYDQDEEGVAAIQELQHALDGIEGTTFHWGVYVDFDEFFDD